MHLWDRALNIPHPAFSENVKENISVKDEKVEI